MMGDSDFEDGELPASPVPPSLDTEPISDSESCKGYRRFTKERPDVDSKPVSDSDSCEVYRRYTKEQSDVDSKNAIGKFCDKENVGKMKNKRRSHKKVKSVIYSSQATRSHLARTVNKKMTIDSDDQFSMDSDSVDCDYTPPSIRQIKRSKQNLRIQVARKEYKDKFSDWRYDVASTITLEKARQEFEAQARSVVKKAKKSNKRPEVNEIEEFIKIRKLMNHNSKDSVTSVINKGVNEAFAEIPSKLDRPPWTDKRKELSRAISDRANGSPPVQLSVIGKPEDETFNQISTTRNDLPEEPNKKVGYCETSRAPISYAGINWNDVLADDFDLLPARTDIVQFGESSSTPLKLDVINNSSSSNFTHSNNSSTESIKNILRGLNTSLGRDDVVDNGPPGVSPPLPYPNIALNIPPQRSSTLIYIEPTDCVIPEVSSKRKRGGSPISVNNLESSLLSHALNSSYFLEDAPKFQRDMEVITAGTNKSNQYGLPARRPISEKSLIDSLMANTRNSYFRDNSPILKSEASVETAVSMSFDSLKSVSAFDFQTNAVAPTVKVVETAMATEPHVPASNIEPSVKNIDDNSGGSDKNITECDMSICSMYNVEDELEDKDGSEDTAEINQTSNSLDREIEVLEDSSSNQERIMPSDSTWRPTADASLSTDCDLLIIEKEMTVKHGVSCPPGDCCSEPTPTPESPSRCAAAQEENLKTCFDQCDEQSCQSQASEEEEEGGGVLVIDEKAHDSKEEECDEAAALSDASDDSSIIVEYQSWDKFGGRADSECCQEWPEESLQSATVTLSQQYQLVNEHSQTMVGEEDRGIANYPLFSEFENEITTPSEDGSVIVEWQSSAYFERRVDEEDIPKDPIAAPPTIEGGPKEKETEPEMEVCVSMEQEEKEEKCEEVTVLSGTTFQTEIGLSDSKRQEKSIPVTKPEIRKELVERLGPIWPVLNDRDILISSDEARTSSCIAKSPLDGSKTSEIGGVKHRLGPCVAPDDKVSPRTEDNISLTPLENITPLSETSGTLSVKDRLGPTNSVNKLLTFSTDSKSLSATIKGLEHSAEVLTCGSQVVSVQERLGPYQPAQETSKMTTATKSSTAASGQPHRVQPQLNKLSTPNRVVNHLGISKTTLDFSPDVLYFNGERQQNIIDQGLNRGFVNFANPIQLDTHVKSNIKERLGPKSSVSNETVTAIHSSLPANDAKIKLNRLSSQNKTSSKKGKQMKRKKEVIKQIAAATVTSTKANQCKGGKGRPQQLPEKQSSEPQLSRPPDPSPPGRLPRADFEFVSQDPLENRDNYNPGWAQLRDVSSDTERYRAVRNRWRNLGIPDPNRDLSFRHRRTSQSGRLQPPPAQISFHPAPCTFMYEAIISQAQEVKMREFDVIQREEQHEEAQLLNRHQQLQMQCYNNNGGMLFFNGASPFWNQAQELNNLKAMFAERRNRAEWELQQVIGKYENYKDEVRTFQSFYQGLDTKEDKTILTPRQTLLIQETERMYHEYSRVYNN